jgi:Starch-binding associating with outer membrane
MKKGIFAMILALGLSSCNEYLDINRDPSFPQVSDVNGVLPPILANMVRGEAFDTRYVGKYVQYFAQSGSGDTWDRHGYIFNSSDVGGEKWSTHYFRIGKNLDLVIEDGQTNQKWDVVGLGKAIRAWSWQTTTDIYGEMIVKQAWEPNRYSFDFDSQEEVYKEVVKLCNEAIESLNRTDGQPATTASRGGDLVYRGDKSKWLKFTYAVLAKNAIRLSNKSTFSADKVIEYCDKSLASNADNFNVPHQGNSSADANFFGPTRNNVTGFRPTNFLLSLLDGTVNKVVDPRLAVYLTPAPDGTYRAVVPIAGDPNNVANNVRRIPTFYGTSPAVTATTNDGKYVFRDKADHPIVTYAEIQFIKAEAAFRKGDRAMALQAYQNGIRAAMEMARTLSGIASPTAAEITTYLGSAAVAKTAEVLTMRDIMLQKYLALFMHGSIETWTDMRRFAYSPDIYPGFYVPSMQLLWPDNAGKLAQRIRPRYNSEFVWNKDALQKIGGLNLDYHTYEMWFTKP